MKNTQIDVYRSDRPLKEHEARQLELIGKAYPEFEGRCLDIGCAAGTTLAQLKTRYPRANPVGIDISEELIALARERVPAARLEVADALKYQPEAPFDFIVASGVLSIFDDFVQPLERWLSWLAPGGHLFVFGRFNTRDVDTIVRVRNNHTNGEWEGGLTAYSVQTVGRHLDALGKRYEFERFHLSLELAESEDPIRTWTVDTSDGQRLVINGANLVAEHYFLTVVN